MKGQSKIPEIVGIIILFAVTVFFAAVILPKYMENLIVMLTYGSGEFVSRDMSGIITLLNATRHSEINYGFLSKEISYDITIKDRVLSVKPNSKVSYVAKLTGFDYIGIEVGNHVLNEVKGVLSFTYPPLKFNQ